MLKLITVVLLISSLVCKHYIVKTKGREMQGFILIGVVAQKIPFTHTNFFLYQIEKIRITTTQRMMVKKGGSMFKGHFRGLNGLKSKSGRIHCH